MNRNRDNRRGAWLGIITAGLALLLLFTAPIAGPAGCAYPESGSKGFSGAAHIWPSTEDQPATLTLFDTRTGEPIWTMEIPVGKQLVTRFRPDKGYDEIARPDLLKYEVFDRGTKWGVLRNALAVPNAASRRWELTIRPAPEYAQPDDPEGYHTEMAEDHPAWQTDQGGILPEKSNWPFDDQ